VNGGVLDKGQNVSADEQLIQCVYRDEFVELGDPSGD
jgi:hypothetical protein